MKQARKKGLHVAPPFLPPLGVPLLFSGGRKSSSERAATKELKQNIKFSRQERRRGKGREGKKRGKERHERDGGRGEKANSERGGREGGREGGEATKGHCLAILR